MPPTWTATTSGACRSSTSTTSAGAPVAPSHRRRDASADVLCAQEWTPEGAAAAAEAKESSGRKRPLTARPSLTRGATHSPSRAA